MNRILKPPKLKRGDIIGVIATSFPFPKDRKSDYYKSYERGIEILRKLGFKIRHGKNLEKVKWWFAGTPEERASDINSMFSDPEVKAIIVHDGGQSAIAVLEHINYDLMRTNPKPFLGFSDITNLHLAFLTQSDMVGFHMGLLTYSLGWIWHDVVPKEDRENGEKLLYKILTSCEPLGKITPITEWEEWRPGKAEGRLFGGNLNMLASLVGTRYFPRIEDLEGSILFWEIDNTPSYYIERGLYQLKYAGVLDIISGMLIGKLPDIKRTAWKGFKEPTPKEIVMEVLREYKFPILGEVDFGHKTVNIPMPIGLPVKMDSGRLTLEFLEAAVY